MTTHKRRWSAILLATGLTMAAAACGGGDDDDTTRRENTPPPSERPTTTPPTNGPGDCTVGEYWDLDTETCQPLDEDPPTTPGGDGSGGGTTTTNGGMFSIRVDGGGCSLAPDHDMEGAFPAAVDMAEYVSCFLPRIEEWIDVTYDSMSHPANYYYIPSGVTGASACGAAYSDTDLFYCPTDQSIYLGEAELWEHYSTYGDGAGLVIVAHETTHHFQSQAGMAETTRTFAQVQYENQSDCGAGAFNDYMYDLGLLDTEDDLTDLSGSLDSLASAEGPNRDHGTSQERLDAYNLGWQAFDGPNDDGSLEQSLYACVPIVNDVALIN
jgi:Putative neutral zinc metallopeptidase